MKALKLSGFALCLLGMFSSCTKDTLETSSTSSASMESLLATNNGKGKVNEVQPANPGNSQGDGNDKATATVEYTISPNPAELTDMVTISGTITFSKPVDQFVLGVEKSTTEDGANMDGSIIWTDFAGTGFGDNVNLTTPQTITSKTFSYSFPASDLGLGKTGWQIHVGGQDVDNFLSNVTTLEVLKPCDPLKLEGTLTNVTSKGDNEYEFEVTYKVTSCPVYTGAKLQGGLTAVTGFTEAGLSSSDATAIADERKNTKNDNHIIQWNFEVTEGYDHWFKVKFTKKLKETGPQEITGGWSVEATDPRTGEKIRVETPAIVFPG